VLRLCVDGQNLYELLNGAYLAVHVLIGLVNGLQRIPVCCLVDGAGEITVGKENQHKGHKKDQHRDDRYEFVHDTDGFLIFH
jgi:hypothetical protein